MQTAQHAGAGAGAVVLERYRLIEELGSGGFGAVWLARDERLERPVAIKRIPVRHASAEAVARAEREALTAARLSHPAVVALYESGRDAGAVYLVSELVRGATLGELLREGALSDRDVVLIGMAICDALAHAHSRGVVHRDVKPGNVLVPESPGDGVVAKLTDFGIARMSGDDALTATGDVVGTLAYMAPEQAEGRGTSAASDLYSLALVLYEALSGANPLRRRTPAATARRVGMRLPALRRLRRDLPRELCGAIDTALDPDPALRGSVAALRLALADSLPAVGDEPGTVEAPAWVTEATSEQRPPQRRLRAAVDAATEDRPHAPRRVRVGLGGRAASAALTAGLVPFVLSLAGAGATLDPLPAAAAAGLAVALLPRTGWLLVAAGLVGWLAHAGGEPWSRVALAALPLPLLLARRPAWWSAPGVAVGLGQLALAAAWPALAGQARGPWARAVLAVAGLWWVGLAESLLGRALLLGPPGDLAGPTGRSWLAVGAVWAAAAVALPWLVRGRRVAADLLAACAWAAALALGTHAAAQVGGSGDPRGLVGAAALAALAALGGAALRRA